MKAAQQFQLFDDEPETKPNRLQMDNHKLNELLREAMKSPVFNSKEEYYNSPQWRSKRRQKLTEKKYRCERCGKTRHLHVHHLSYLNLYNEPLSDLQVVCRDCHPIADAIREYDSALDTYIDKVYGEDCDFIDMEQVSEEFDEWLRWQE